MVTRNWATANKNNPGIILLCLVKPVEDERVVKLPGQLKRLLEAVLDSSFLQATAFP
jgi:hypothetical protein